MKTTNFFFTRIKYTSGNWDTDQRMPSNILHSLVEYTTIPVDEKERIIELSSEEIYKSPFCYLSGHKLVDGEGRVMRGRVGSAQVTDGPYAEAREVIGGLFIVEARGYEEVVALCQDCPHLEFGSIEIREIEPTD